MFFRLWQNPSIVARIRKEADAVLGAGHEARKMEYDMVKELPYLNAVFYETARVSFACLSLLIFPADPSHFPASSRSVQEYQRGGS